MLTENQLREQVMRKIEQLPADKLQDINDYINFLENSLNESLKEYISLQNTETDSVTATDTLPEELFTPDEVFKELYDRLEKHYGVDLRTL